MKNPMCNTEEILERLAECKMGEIAIFEIGLNVFVNNLIGEADTKFPHTRFAMETFLTESGKRMIAVYANSKKKTSEL